MRDPHDATTQHLFEPLILDGLRSAWATRQATEIVFSHIRVRRSILERTLDRVCVDLAPDTAAALRASNLADFDARR